MKNEKKIAFLVRKSDEVRCAAALESLQALRLPTGYEAELFTLAAEEPYAAQANKALTLSDAKFKIYLNDDIRLAEPDVLGELLQIFEDESIGMVGFLGSASLPASGNLMESPYVWGAAYVPSEEGRRDLRFGRGTVGECRTVRFLAPSFFATQRDLAWDTCYQRQYYALLAHCRRFEREGDRIVVPLAKEPWCAYQERAISFDADESERRKFFAAHHAYLTDDVPDETQILYACGAGSSVEGWREFSAPEAVSVGAGVKIHRTALCRMAYEDFAGEPRIVIGDACEIDAYSTLTAARRIVLENFVTLAPNVHLIDKVHSGGAFALSSCGSSLDERGMRIGRATKIAANAVVKGAVHIGRGSLVEENAVVVSDIPDYCVAAGNPARVVQAFSVQAGKWLPVKDAAALEDIVEERRKAPPLLTYAVITYNRSEYLAKSLACVLEQVGNDDLVEVLVSDNASTDATKDVVRRLQKKYRNLRYHCNEKNVGAEKNIHCALRESAGEYVTVAGDDDYSFDGSLQDLLSAVAAYRGAALFHLVNRAIPLDVRKGSGAAAYVGQVGYFMTWLSAVIMRRDLYHAIRDPEKYDYTRLPQVYLQMEMLRQNPDFVVLTRRFFRLGTGEHGGSDDRFAETFIRDYLKILTAEATISPDVLSAEKWRLMEGKILPTCERIRAEGRALSFRQIFDIIDEYYAKEPYYPQIVDRLRKISPDVFI